MAGFFGFREGAKLSKRQFKTQLDRVYRWYTAGLVLFVVVLAGLERLGLPRLWIGFSFLLATIALYAAIGVMSRTTDAAEYYVAGRRVPAVYNGMATGADWMSAAREAAGCSSLALRASDRCLNKARTCSSLGSVASSFSLAVTFSS